MALAPKSISEMINHESSWDWENSHVSQSYLGPYDVGESTRQSVAINDIVESGTVLICAGPADLDKATGLSTTADSTTAPAGFRIVPIGLVESAQISMNKPLSRIFEIGSKLSYIIPGRTVGGISLSRVFFDGPSILKALYFGEVKQDQSSGKKKYAKFTSNKRGASDAWMEMANIGSGNLAMNLASTFFDQPVGLAFYFKDRQSDMVSQIYFEGCSVSSYNLGISANMNVLTESVNMEFVRCRPITTALSNSVVANVMMDKNIVTTNTVYDESAITTAASGSTGTLLG